MKNRLEKRFCDRGQGKREGKQLNSKGSTHYQLVSDYWIKIENELREICQAVLDLLDSRLIPSATTTDCKIFYLKMQGDYFRYLAEFLKGKE